MVREDLNELHLQILTHLSQRYRDGPRNRYDGPAEHTQPGIAEAVGRVRSNVANHLADLIAREMIVIHRLHAEPLGRRRQVYFITPTGLAFLSEHHA